MIIKKIFIIILFIFLHNFFCYSQETARLTKPRLELKDSQINIFYDILNSQQTDTFRIWIEITDSTGKIIDAKSVSGDIGYNVSGGNNKMIIWNLAADSIYLDAGIYIQVNAEVLKTEETVEIIKPVRSVKRGQAIFQSIIFPGWGLSRINKGKPHWLMGLAGYGCITASIIYNKMAIYSYDLYRNANSIQDLEDFYNSSVKEDNLSEAFAYAAIGIWVTDFIWTVAGSSKLNNKPVNSQAKSLSIKTFYEPGMHAPVVALRYNF